MAKIGLVLTGGGARGAYQAGVLEAIAQLVPAGPIPFQVLTGVSAGALNAAFLASRADDFQSATRDLSALWSTLRPEQVIRTSIWAVLAQGLRVLRNLVGGGLVYSERRNHLLDTSPLETLISGMIDPAKIRAHLNAGRLHAVGLTTTNYLTGSSVTHYMARERIEDWDRQNHVSIEAQLGPEHVLASSALPLFFPPVRINESFHGDGSMRLAAPFRPAIHLGAERILAVHLRHRDPAASVRAQNLLPMKSISLADIGGVMMNSIFHDSIDMDLDRLQRINRTLGIMTPDQREHLPDHLRPIPVVLMRPSRDPAHLAGKHFRALPRVLRYLLRGLGAHADSSSDLTSYLAFHANYCSELVQLGRDDVQAQQTALRALLS